MGFFAGETVRLALLYLLQLKEMSETHGIRTGHTQFIIIQSWGKYIYRFLLRNMYCVDNPSALVRTCLPVYVICITASPVLFLHEPLFHIYLFIRRMTRYNIFEWEFIVFKYMRAHMNTFSTYTIATEIEIVCIFLCANNIKQWCYGRGWATERPSAIRPTEGNATGKKSFWRTYYSLQ